MKLLVEKILDVKTNILEENSKKRYFIEGIFLHAETKNQNGRVYPRHVLEKEVARYQTEYIDRKRAFGNCDHPLEPQTKMKDVSHLITEITQDGNLFYGKAKIIDGGFGKIIRALIDEGASFGASSRGVGSVVENNGELIVAEDFMLISAADIVADPSGVNCFVNGIAEQREWVYENGIFKESKLEEFRKKELKSGIEKQILENFNSFLKKFI